MKFIIHSLKLTDEAIELETDIGEPCYIPGRDTPQTEVDEILKANLLALIESDDDVYVIWDGSSLGTLFDMGSAYALGKAIWPVYLVGNRSWPAFFSSMIGGEIKYENK